MMYKISIVILALIMVSCRPDQTANTIEVGHQHAEEAVQVTLFTENHEFFIVHDPLEAGEESEFLVYITQLDTYQPLSGGRLKITAGKATTSAEAPDQAGIFHLSLTPVEEGELHISYCLSINSETIEVEQHTKVHEAHDGEANAMGKMAANENLHDESDEAGEVQFLKEQAWKGNFMVTKIKTAPFSSVIHVGGEILAMPGIKQVVAANNGGFVSFANSQIVQGSIVEKGQKILSIISNSLGDDDIGLRYRSLRNALNKSRSEYNRLLSLYRNHVVSEKQLIESRTLYTSDSIRFYNLADRVSSDGVDIIAPSTGYIHLLNVDEGQFVAMGQQLFLLSSDNKLLLRADIPQQFYQEVKMIESANFRTAYSNELFSIEDFNGTLKSRVKSVAENNHYLPLYFELENDGSLLEGAFAELFLKSKEKKDALIVPVSSLLEEQGAFYVYLQKTGDSYTKKEVTIGASDGYSVEILTGLSQGDRIVTEGVMLVKAASMVVGDGGHGHQH